jgi:hypothetical protein
MASGMLLLFACQSFKKQPLDQAKQKQTLKSIPDGLYGEWDVRFVTESDYDLGDGALIKGPFTNTPKEETVLFLSDSMRYTAPENISRYQYRIVNDSLLQLRNKASGTVLEMHLRYLTRDSMAFLNKRTDTSREMRYEMTVTCKRKLNSTY